jgi:hypothetical protein
MLDSHPSMPLVELFEQVRIDLEQVERGGVGQGGRFHEAEEQEEIVEFGGLLPEIVLVAAEGHTVHELAQTVTEFREFVGPIHTVIISRSVYS